VCGIAEQGDDNDGNGKGGLGEEETTEHLKAIDAAADRDTLQKAFGKAWKAAEAANDRGSMRLFTEHKDTRKKALGVKS
jgi:hypothetical protein